MIVLATRASLRGLLIVTMFFLVLLFGIAIAAMAILRSTYASVLPSGAGGKYKRSNNGQNSTHAG